MTQSNDIQEFKLTLLQKPNLNQQEAQLLKQGAFLMLKAANLTDPFDNTRYEEKSNQLFKSLLSSYCIFTARILEISNLFVAKSRPLFYFGMCFFPTLTYGLFSTNPMTSYQQQMDKKYTELYFKTYGGHNILEKIQ